MFRRVMCLLGRHRYRLILCAELVYWRCRDCGRCALPPKRKP